MFDQRPPEDAPTRRSGLFQAASFAVGTGRHTVRLVSRVRYLLLAAMLYFQGAILSYGVLGSVFFSGGLGNILMFVTLGGLCIGALFYGGTWAFRKALRPC